ncbi:hypothetical protein GT370_07275 [Acidocella sp. MX-AZ03]|uniref:arabinofuranosidase catalytic domain-containing protein n=1 Tax=Acidocella sp. MX-AZ03 TaxID=2697363 RepID=UPI0022DD1CFF|nr:arabinofuranosidase catalytic domain-containing protein [Acidocella sp. MX-AZ03]WBO60564.1 hypothetical protein GT370_07275 [Acidocella sp. MX-AZ03]
MIRATRFALLVVAALGLAGIASMAIAQPAPPGAIYQTSTARLIGPQPPQCCVTNWMTTKPIAEYSFRRLNASYNGPDILVRRASDNAQQAIYFWHDWVNLKALMSFCSATSCYLVTWYDQSGNGYDATQTTAADQGIVVNNGSLVTRVGKPALDASNASAGLAIPASASATGSAPRLTSRSQRYLT